ncbi:MAG: hypothetical protein IIU35_05235 [Neisseriaceae bacterium]|nr:hypothetical protein [Neisseriaceae bacterium]
MRVTQSNIQKTATNGGLIVSGCLKETPAKLVDVRAVQSYSSTEKRRHNK